MMEGVMRILVIGRQLTQGRCLRVIASALAVLVLVAVPALGITHFGGAALASWGRAGSPEGGSLVESLLPFDAPAVPVAEHQALAEASRKAEAAREAATELTDWSFTQNKQIDDLAALLSLMDTNVANIFVAIGAGASAQQILGLQANNLFAFRAAAAASGNADLVSMVDTEISFLTFLFASGADITLLNQIAFTCQQLNFFATSQSLTIAKSVSPS